MDDLAPLTELPRLIATAVVVAFLIGCAVALIWRAVR